MGMKRKRKIEEENDEIPKDKILKRDETEVVEKTLKKNVKKDIDFDVKHFRTEIKSKTGQTVPLVQFLQVCLNTKGSVDYLKQYLDSGGNANEILRQLDEENKKNPLVVSPVFNLLHLIFTMVQSSHPQHLQQVQETCRYFLNTYISTIDFMLSEKSNARQQKITLQLLTTIVTLSSELAFSVLNQLSLQPKTLIHLVKGQSNVKDKDDVRKSFIFFLMSFFLDGNTTLIKALLDKNGLVALIMPDLVKDKIEIVLMVLEMLKKTIVNNLSISKTIKIRTFNQTMLSNIFNLFNWKVCNLKTDEGLKLKSEVEESVFEFLFTLFTSHKHGIYFADRFLGTGDTLTNQHLCKAIENLEGPWSNEKAGELIIKIVSHCPDLNKPVLHLVEQSFEPRHSEQWLKCVKFLTNVFNSLPAKHVVSLMSDMNPVQITNFVRNVYLPSKILQVCNSTLNASDGAIKNQIISLLKIMLSSVKSFLVQMNFADENFVKVKALLKNRLEEFIPKHFPTTDLLISVLHSALNDESEDTPADSTTTFKIQSAKNSTFVISILDLLLMYNDILPNSLDPIATMLDSKRLLERVETFGASDDIGELKLKIIMFLLGADKFAFAPEKPLFKEILHSMFEVYITSENKISESAKNVLYSILETTGIFERNVSEIDLLLSVVKVVGKDFKNVVRHVVEIVESVLKHLPKYSECVSSICKMEDRDTTYKQYVDIYFEHLDAEEEFVTETVLTVEKSSCTPFVIGILKHKNNSDEFTQFSKYFLISLYHNQENPQHLQEILQGYSIDSSINKYISIWTNKPTKLTSKLVDKSCVLYKLSSILVNDEEAMDLYDVFDLSVCEDGDTTNIFIMNGQTFTFSPEQSMPYVNQCVDMILFYIVQQNNINTLNLNKIDNALKALHCLMSMNVSNSTEDVRMIRNIVEKCLTHKILVQKFSPFNKNDLLTKFIYDLIFLSKNTFETNFLSSLLKPFKHKLYMSLMIEIKKCNETKNGIVLNEISSFLSTIDLLYSDANCIVRELLKIDVSCMITNDDEMSSWIHVLCYVIKLFIRNSKAFSHRTMQGISLLYFKMITNLNVVINLQEFEESYLNYLHSNPECILTVPHKVFKAIFSIKHVSKFTSNLGALLLKTDSRLLPFFKTNVVKDETIQKRELILPLMSAAFTHNDFTASTNLIKQIYENYKPNIIKILEKPHKASQIYVDYSGLIVKLINKCMDVKECEDFCKKTLKCESLECFHVDLVEEIYFKAYFNTKNVLYINNYLLFVLHLINVSFKKETPTPEKLAKVADTIQKILLICHNDKIKSDSLTSVCDNSSFQIFFKSILKTFIKTEQNDLYDSNEHCLFGLTSSLIHTVYPKNHESILNMFEMTTSHSEFLNVMLSNRQTNVKTQLVKLLLVMALNNKEVMKSTHLPVYLSSYHASLKQCDRYLLYLLKFYESNGHSMKEYQPYLWGDTAANHYAVRSKRSKSSLWSNPTANHILNLLDKEIIERTIKDFPMNATLNIEEEMNKDIDYLFGIDEREMNHIRDDVLNKIYVKKPSNQSNSVDLNMDIIKSKIVVKNLIETKNSHRSFSTDIYDPAFILPLLNFVVSPGSAVSCHRIIRGGILSIPFIALSSNCPSVRAAAFSILHRFYTLLESEMYYRNDKVLWSQFIETLKSSLDSVNSQDKHDNNFAVPKLPTLGALYLARSALVMTHPLDPMFKPINNFVISKQYINFTVIPDFLDIFHNTDVSFIERRTWMLKLLRDGIKITDDIDVILKSVAFKMILDFYSSSLCDVKQKILILEILNTCILIPKTAKLLVEGFGLFTWLSNVFNDLNPESKKLVTIAVHLVSNLWVSLALETNKSVHIKLVEERNDSIFGDILSGKCLKLSETLQINVLYLLVDLSSKLSNISPNDMKIYLNVLNKIPKSCLKNGMSTQQMSSLIDVVESLYSGNVVVRAMKNIVKDNKKDCLFNCYTIGELSSGGEEENCIINSLHSSIFKWLLQ